MSCWLLTWSRRRSSLLLMPEEPVVLLTFVPSLFKQEAPDQVQHSSNIILHDLTLVRKTASATTCYLLEGFKGLSSSWTSISYLLSRKTTCRQSWRT